LLFRCPICNEFQFSRLKQYIWSDTTLSKAAERSIRIQRVLDEAEKGDVVLHKHVSAREISALEPIADSVFRGRYTNQPVAVKYFKPYFIGFEWSRFRREVAILRMCEHPNIITFIGAYVPDAQEITSFNWKDDATQVKPFIVLEYHPDTLSEVVRTQNRVLPLPKTLLYGHQIAIGIQFLHSIGIVHRDLKPANVVISTDGKAKLIDFGESRILKNSNDQLTKVGTPFYEAPEVGKGSYNEKVDSYSFGKMFFEMVTKSVNPSALAQRSFYEKNNKTDVQDFAVIEKCDDEIILNLIVACCQLVPASRPDFEVICKQLHEVQLRHLQN